MKFSPDVGYNPSNPDIQKKKKKKVQKLSYVIKWNDILVHLTRLYSPSVSQACLNVVQQTLNKLLVKSSCQLHL